MTNIIPAYFSIKSIEYISGSQHAQAYIRLSYPFLKKNIGIFLGCQRIRL